MLYNLVENAIRYTNPGGSVDVGVEFEPTEGAVSARGIGPTGGAGVGRTDNTVVVRVRDTGIGIPAELHDKVFERFFCVDRSRSRDTGGTGLGLAIVKHAARLHNATIDLQSTEGQGTTIELRFSPQ
jgi:two-component system phosphate regulon sensor histidine kinase PhoR